MQQFKKHYFLLVFILAAIFGCNNDPSKIGIDLQNDKVKIVFSDTATIRAFSIREDSIRTDETTVSLLGSLFDPVFGKTTASIYTQIRLSTTSVSFGTSPVLDSIVLALEYTGAYYGDTTTQQTFRVFEISDSLMRDSSYYSNQTKPIIQPEIGSFTMAPRPSDSVYIDTVKYKAQLRIPLNEDFGNKILNASTDELATGDDFLRFMKGICITTDAVSNGGAVLYFTLVSNYSRVTIYYHNSPDTLKNYNFPISDYCARFMNFNHDNYQDADQNFINQVILKDATLGSEMLYLQPMAGVKTTIKLPFIREFIRDSILGTYIKNIAINEAKLVIYNYDKNSEFEPAQGLLLLKVLDTNGTSTLIEDYYEGSTYFGGNYDSINGEYYFRISRYVQNLLKDDTIQDYGLYLIVSGGSLQANRVLLNGYNPTFNNNRLKLKLTYTKLSN